MLYLAVQVSWESKVESDAKRVSLDLYCLKEELRYAER